MKKKLLIIFFIIFFLIFAANIFGKGWIIYHDGSYRGKVVDADTGSPIEGAAVAGVWWLNLIGPAQGPIPSFCDAQEAITDNNGEFVVPRAFCWHIWPLIKMGNLQFVVFKPGYLSFPPRVFKNSPFTGDEFKNKKKYQIIKLKKAMTREERLSSKSLVNIFSEDIIMKKAPYLLKLINKERRHLGLRGEIKPAVKGDQ